MLHEVVLSPDVHHLPEADLRDDSAELAARGRNTMRGRAIARRERLTRDYEGRRVGPEVLEEVGETVKEDKRLSAGVGSDELVVSEA